jgi:hypothetical protein
MAADAADRRDGLPITVLSLRADPTAAPVAEWVREQVARFVDGRVHTHAGDDAHDHRH